jgi:hypothetical protein
MTYEYGLGKTETLRDLIEAYGSNAFLLADTSAYNGDYVTIDGQYDDRDAIMAEYGNVSLTRRNGKLNGHEYTYISPWLTNDRYGDAYRYRVAF